MIRNAEHEIVDGDDFKTLERRKRLHTVGATLAAVLLDPDLDRGRR